MSGSADLFLTTYKYFKNEILKGFCDIEEAEIDKILQDDDENEDDSGEISGQEW